MEQLFRSCDALILNFMLRRGTLRQVDGRSYSPVGAKALHLLTMPLDRESRHPSCLADIDHCSTQSTSAHTPGAHQEAPELLQTLDRRHTRHRK
jgi:hypothetical protein